MNNNRSMNSDKLNNVDPSEIQKFEKLAAEPEVGICFGNASRLGHNEELWRPILI